ncbi:MAG: cysteine dioxygenase family protein [Planctomycetota bacterium]
MTKTLALPPVLAPLVERLERLDRRARVNELEGWLHEFQITAKDVSLFVRFGEKNYLRNLVCAGEWFHLLVICWRSGQRSPIHNHAGSTCGVRVLRGTATETRFEFTASGLIRPTISHDMHEGEVVVSQDAEIHQISNLQARGEDLITLHIYSPPLVRMDSYSLTETAIQEYRPITHEFSMGDGI